MAIGLLLAGCTSGDLAKLTAARTETVAAVASAKDSEAVLRSQIDALPVSDPVRKTLEPKLAELDSAIARGEQYLPVVDGAIQSAQSGQIDPAVSAAVSAVPYGSLALAAIGLVWATVKHVQASSALEQHAKTQLALKQVVSALDAAVPEPTPAQNGAIAGVLDADVKARVAAVRAM